MPLCRFHRRLKTHGGWTARFTTPDEPHPSGTVEWTTPFGLQYYDVPRIHDLDFGEPDAGAANNGR